MTGTDRQSNWRTKCEFAVVAAWQLLNSYKMSFRRLKGKAWEQNATR